MIKIVKDNTKLNNAKIIGSLRSWLLSANEVIFPDPKVKRIFDFLLAFLGIIIFFPIFLAITVAIYLEDGFPILYSQDRIGFRGKLYKMYKFRSMVKNAEKSNPVRAKENDPRVTKVGKIIRATAMDELPQLFNILKGDMSFVGPRSYREFFVNQFRQQVPNYDLCHIVRPGLTGLAQVYGSKNISPRHKLWLDLLYIKNRSMLLDIKLILISIWITIRRRWESRNRKIKRIKIGRWRIT